MLYFLDIAEKMVPVFLVITGKVMLIIRVIPINSRFTIFNYTVHVFDN